MDSNELSSSQKLMDKSPILSTNEAISIEPLCETPKTEDTSQLIMNIAHSMDLEGPQDEIDQSKDSDNIVKRKRGRPKKQKPTDTDQLIGDSQCMNENQLTDKDTEPASDKIEQVDPNQSNYTNYQLTEDISQSNNDNKQEIINTTKPKRGRPRKNLPSIRLPMREDRLIDVHELMDVDELMETPNTNTLIQASAIDQLLDGKTSIIEEPKRGRGRPKKKSAHIDHFIERKTSERSEFDQLLEENDSGLSKSKKEPSNVNTLSDEEAKSREMYEQTKQLVQPCLELAKNKSHSSQQAQAEILAKIVVELVALGTYDQFLNSVQNKTENSSCVILPSRKCRMLSHKGNKMFRDEISSDSKVLKMSCIDVCINPFHIRMSKGASLSPQPSTLVMPVKSITAEASPASATNPKAVGKQSKKPTGVKRKLSATMAGQPPAGVSKKRANTCLQNKFKEEWLTSSASPSSNQQQQQYKENLTWVNVDDKTFKQMTNVSPKYNHWATLVQGMRGITSDRFNNVILYCKDGHMMVNRLVIFVCFPVLSTVEQYFDYEIILPDYTRAEITQQFENFLDDLSGNALSSPQPVERQEESLVDANRKLTIPVDIIPNKVLSNLYPEAAKQLALYDTAGGKRKSRLSSESSPVDGRKLNYRKKCDICGVRFKKLVTFAYHKCVNDGCPSTCVICAQKFDGNNCYGHFSANSKCRQLLADRYPSELSELSSTTATTPTSVITGNSSNTSKPPKLPKVSKSKNARDCKKVCEPCGLEFRDTVRYHYHACLYTGSTDSCVVCHAKLVKDAPLHHHFTKESSCRKQIQDLYRKKGKPKELSTAESDTSFTSDLSTASPSKPIVEVNLFDREPKIDLVKIFAESRTVNVAAIENTLVSNSSKSTAAAKKKPGAAKKIAQPNEKITTAAAQIVDDNGGSVSMDDFFGLTEFEIEIDDGDKDVSMDMEMEDPAMNIDQDNSEGHSVLIDEDNVTETEYLMNDGGEMRTDTNDTSVSDSMGLVIEDPKSVVEEATPSATVSQSNRVRRGRTRQDDSGDPQSDWTLPCTGCNLFLPESELGAHKCKGKHYCIECDQQFKNRSAHKQHDQIYHGAGANNMGTGTDAASDEPEIVDVVTREINCSSCQQCFLSNDALNMHLRLVSTCRQSTRENSLTESTGTIIAPTTDKQKTQKDVFVKTESSPIQALTEPVSAENHPATNKSESEPEQVKPMIFVKKEFQSCSGIVSVPSIMEPCITVPSIMESCKNDVPSMIAPCKREEEDNNVKGVNQSVSAKPDQDEESFDFLRVPSSMGLKAIKRYFNEHQVTVINIKLIESNAKLLYHSLRIKVDGKDVEKILSNDLRPGNSTRLLTKNAPSNDN